MNNPAAYGELASTIFVSIRIDQLSALCQNWYMKDGGLGRAFQPKSIAIVGVSRTEGNSPPGYTGMMFLHQL